MFGALVGWVPVGSEAYVELGLLLTVIVGAIRVLIGIVLAHLMSEPTLMGFVPAGAILIVASQLPTALGVAGAGDKGVLGAAVSAVAEPRAWDWRAIALALAAAAFGHLHHSLLDHEHGEYLLLPTYRRPTLFHTPSGNAKHLNDFSHTHPLLVHPEDTERIGLATNDLARVETEIGFFVLKALVTEGIRPGVVAALHHMGRGRLREDSGGERWSSAIMDMTEGPDNVRFRQLHGVRPWTSDDPSPERIWWSDAGVHHNITFPVDPDPVSGMHCRHQEVRISHARPDDHNADIVVDFARARQV